jgi:hypothetical protein
MADELFMDFDAAAAERGPKKKARIAKFVYGGETFEVDLNVHAGTMLLWMRGGQSLSAVPEMLVMFLGEDRFQELCALDDPDWEELQEVIEWLAGLLGESGN